MSGSLFARRLGTSDHQEFIAQREGKKRDNTSFIAQGAGKKEEIANNRYR